MKLLIRNTFFRVESLGDRLCGPELNPFHQLGALGWFFSWIVLGTGLYLFIPFETSVGGAWESVEYITVHQWWLGGIVRSLHRYGSDCMVAVMVIHLLREFAMDRYHGARWFAWITGVPLIWLILASGVTGYWLVWDELAQYLGVGTAEWLDWLGIFGQSIARNFLTRGSLTDRFFTLLIFIHIAVPLFLLFGMWIHILRVNHPAMTPPRKMRLWTTAMLLGLSLVFPAKSHPPADLGRASDVLNPDWFYMALYPAFDTWGPAVAWALALGLTAVIAIVPWVGRRRRAAAAVVQLSECSGCGHCAADCPFGAVVMRPRMDGLAHEKQAVMQPDLCTGCGICVGSCPSSTPFRKSKPMISGIELESLPVEALRDRVLAAAAPLTGPARLLVLGCDHGVDLKRFETPSVAALSLPCTGMLPPSFLDFILSRSGANGVVVTGCRGGECHHRLGPQWTDARIAAAREPHLPKRTDRDRLRVVWAAPTDPDPIAAAIAQLSEVKS
ncbi:MAG: cytochrome b N-terminal domain-containing protein [Alphaproteobacteria bacterium]|nr:cytochrome b N-terminal domain-containing protein [Alphaproteobacteria bacterium]